MEPMGPLDAAMMTGEVLSNPLHVAALLILAPPGDAGPGYVDQWYRDGLAAADVLDPDSEGGDRFACRRWIQPAESLGWTAFLVTGCPLDRDGDDTSGGSDLAGA